MALYRVYEEGEETPFDGPTFLPHTVLGKKLGLFLIPGLRLPEDEARFWTSCDQQGPDDCWLWQAYWDDMGRGRFRIQRRTYRAARIAYVLAHKDEIIPAGIVVRHTCDEMRCINPAHLVLGPQAANVDDMIARGRGRNQSTGTLGKVVPRYQPRPQVRLSLEQRLHAGVDKRGPDDCWPWKGAVNKGIRNGYGHISWNINEQKGSARTHRLAYEIAYGQIPEDLVIHHTCEGRYKPGDKSYKLCCNPLHLKAVTPEESNLEMAHNGRLARGERSGRYTKPERTARGDRHGLRMHPERAAHGNRNGSRTHPERLKRGDENSSRTHPERLKRGEDNHKAKLSADQIPEIRLMRDSCITYTEIGVIYGISSVQARNICLRKSWKHIP